jgi:hypothetical protein
MNKISKIACFVIFSALLTSGFPNFMMQEAHAATNSVTLNNIVNNERISADFTVNYTIANDGGGDDTTAGSITFTRTGGTADAGAHTYNNVDGMTITSGTFAITKATLEGVAGFDNLVDGTIYTVTVSVTSTANGALTATATGVTFDTSAPTMDSAEVTSTTTIDVTFSEDILDAETADFTLDNNLTVASISETGGVVTITTNEIIPNGVTPIVTLANDGVTDNIDNTTPNTLAAGPTVTATTTLTASGGGGCDSDCEEPTLGLLPNGQRIVDDGFTYNGHSVDVERFFTPYPLITAQTGKQNTAVFKIYENRGPNNIAHFDFAFGLGKDQIISDSKAMIEVDFARDGTQTINIVDPENALDNVSVTTDTVACSEGQTQCLEITIKHTFRESLDFDIVGTNVWDHSRQSWQNYYNHGIEVVGPSLNPAKQHDGVNQGHIYHLTETSKTTAVDEFGDAWTFQYGKWMKDYIKQERIQDGQKQVFDRMHSDFASYKENLANEAFIQLAEMCPLCIEEYADFDVATSLEYGNKISKLKNPEIQKIMNLQNSKAQEILKYIMDPKLSSSEKYQASIEKDERPISEILAEERMLSQILQDEHYWLKQIIAPHN